jgi:hypothetical protein
MSDEEMPLISDPSPNAPHPQRHPLRGYPAPRSGEKGERSAEERVPSPGPTGTVRAQRVATWGGDQAVGDEGDPWRGALPEIADRLQEIGYDVASSQSGAPPGGSIVARRDLGDRAVVIAIDAGGRFRAEITWVVGEWPSRDEIAGVPVRVVDAVSRTVTVTGQMNGPNQVVAVIRDLGTIFPWASVSGSETPSPTN